MVVRLAGESDDYLVTRLRAGDDAAFEAIYDRYARGLLAFCVHMLGSREAAEDALQLTFVSAFRALRGGERNIALRPWLYTIARNRCLSELRTRRDVVDSRRSGGKSTIPRGRRGSGRAAGGPTRDAGGHAAAAGGPARGARALRARGSLARRNRCRARRAQREGEGAGLSGARGADAWTARAGAPVRRDPRAASNVAGRGPGPRHGTRPHRPLPELRSIRERGPPSARRAGATSARGADQQLKASVLGSALRSGGALVAGGGTAVGGAGGAGALVAGGGTAVGGAGGAGALVAGGGTAAVARAELARSSRVALGRGRAQRAGSVAAATGAARPK